MINIILIFINFVFMSSTVPGTVLYDRFFNTSTISEKIDNSIQTEVVTNRKWVQTFTQSSWVSSDGKLFLYSNWDEGKRTIGVYKNADVLGNTVPVQSIVSNWGDLTGDETYVYATSNIDYGNYVVAGCGIFRFNQNTYLWSPFQGGVGNYNSYFKIRDSGLCSLYRNITIDVTNGKLFVTDSFDNVNKVFVFNTTPANAMPVDSFVLENIKDIQAYKGYLWIIIGNEIRKYTQTGIYTNTKIILNSPTKLVFNRQNQMMVWDNKDCVVKIYTTDESPKLLKILGTVGGYYSLKNTPRSFFNIFPPNLTGMGTDNNGNVFLTWGYGYPYFTDIRAFTKTGDSLYHQYNSSFVCVAGLDYRKDGTEAFTTSYKFKIDWTKPIDKKSIFLNYTSDYKNNDPVIGGRTEVRYVNNKRILIKDNSDLYGNGFTVYYEDGVFFKKAKTFINGESKAFYMDTLGNVWDANGIYIKEYKFSGFLGNVPIWDTINYRTYKKDNNFTISRIHYEPKTDEMIMTGYDSRFTTHSDKGIGRVIKKYSNFKKPTRTIAWQDTIKMDTLWKLFEKPAMSVEGDYIFIISIGDEPRTLDVFRKLDYSYVGKIQPGVDIQGTVCPDGNCGMIGWIDTPFGITTIKRTNGEYVILIENDLTGNNIVYRWCPSGKCY